MLEFLKFWIFLKFLEIFFGNFRKLFNFFEFVLFIILLIFYYYFFLEIIEFFIILFFRKKFRKKIEKNLDKNSENNLICWIFFCLF